MQNSQNWMQHWCPLQLPLLRRWHTGEVPRSGEQPHGPTDRLAWQPPSPRTVKVRGKPVAQLSRRWNRPWRSCLVSEYRLIRFRHSTASLQQTDDPRSTHGAGASPCRMHRQRGCVPVMLGCRDALACARRNLPNPVGCCSFASRIQHRPRDESRESDMAAVVGRIGHSRDH